MSVTVDQSAYVRDLFQRSVQTKILVMETLCDRMVEIATVCADSLANGGKLLLCGNGGSAADAQHLAAELLVRLRPNVNRDGLPAIALAMDSSAMTACGNDYSYDVFFQRMTSTLGRPGDVLIGITTSGNSQNVILALRAARAKGIKTIGFLGAGGGLALAECDLALVVPSAETGRIQEVHITAGHAIMELIEEMLLDRGQIARV